MIHAVIRNRKHWEDSNVSYRAKKTYDAKELTWFALLHLTRLRVAYVPITRRGVLCGYFGYCEIADQFTLRWVDRGSQATQCFALWFKCCSR